MSERSLSTIEWTPRHENATRVIGVSALELMKHRYGDGRHGGEGGYDRRLAFHHLPHAQTVGRRALRLCEYMGLSLTEQKTAELAGYAHDVVQLQALGTNESKSAEWLVHQLDVFGVPELSGAAMMAILGTEPKFENGVLTHQAVDTYTNEQDDKVIKAVPSADLSALYTPSGPYEAHTLYAEIQGKAPGEQVPLENLLAFQHGQLALLEGYTYPLPEAEKLFATHRSEVMAHHMHILRNLEAGNFDSFQDVLDADRQFKQEQAIRS